MDCDDFLYEKIKNFSFFYLIFGKCRYLHLKLIFIVKSKVIVQVTCIQEFNTSFPLLFWEQVFLVCAFWREQEKLFTKNFLRVTWPSNFKATNLQFFWRWDWTVREIYSSNEWGAFEAAQNLQKISTRNCPHHHTPRKTWVQEIFKAFF